MSDRIVKTVKVVIYVSATGRISLGVLTSEHRGPHRLDRRYGPARPTSRRLLDAPRGADPALWLAYEALGDLLEGLCGEGRSTDL